MTLNKTFNWLQQIFIDISKFEITSYINMSIFEQFITDMMQTE